MLHTTAIDGDRASCPCGWTLEDPDVGRVQAAAIGHELEPPEPTAPAPASTPDLDAVTNASVQLEHTEQAVTNARRIRDQAVCAAVNAGAPIAHVARAAGITRQAVYDIMRRQ